MDFSVQTAYRALITSGNSRKSGATAWGDRSRLSDIGTLINGPRDRIESEAKALIDIGRDGGFIIGTHSISPGIPLDHFALYDDICLSYGDFSS